MEEVSQYGLSIGAHMALVTVGTIYTDLNIGSTRAKPVDTDPLLYSRIQQQAIEPSEAIIYDVDLSVIVQGSVLRLRPSCNVLHPILCTLSLIVFSI